MDSSLVIDIIISNMFGVLLPASLLIIGGIWGWVGQKRHFRSMATQENDLVDITLFNDKPASMEDVVDTHLVQGNVVMSIDYFRFFVGQLIIIIGGNVPTFRLNLERGRREAILRMHQAARDLGANEVHNIKIQSMAIGTGRGVEVLAYGTAIKKRPLYAAQGSAL